MAIAPFSDLDVASAIDAGERRRAEGLWATMARYHAKHDRIELVMAHGWSLVIDRAAIDELAHVPPRR